MRETKRHKAGGEKEIRIDRWSEKEKEGEIDRQTDR